MIPAISSLQWILGLAGIASLVVTIQHFRIGHHKDNAEVLQMQLNDCMAQRQVLSVEAQKLRQTIDMQNAAIEGYKRSTARLQERLEAAQEAAVIAVDVAQRRIEELEGRQGESCEEAVDLIDEALSLQ